MKKIKRIFAALMAVSVAMPFIQSSANAEEMWVEPVEVVEVLDSEIPAVNEDVFNLEEMPLETPEVSMNEVPMLNEFLQVLNGDESSVDDEDEDSKTDVLAELGEDAAEVSGLSLPVIPMYSEEEVELLAKLIWHEAEAEPIEGKIAVGEVIVNRIQSAICPDNIADVIYQPGQFSHVGSVKNENPDAETYMIAEGVLNNGLRIFNNPKVLFFRNPKKVSGIAAATRKNWGDYEYYMCYGNHAFYTYAVEDYN